jgi:DNA-binding XRE family transcriptional regulator
VDEAAKELRAATRFATGRFAVRATRVPGRTLALFREAAGVDAARVAAFLGVTKQRVANVEREGCPRAYAERFRFAVVQAANGEQTDNEAAAEEATWD